MSKELRDDLERVRRAISEENDRIGGYKALIDISKKRKEDVKNELLKYAKFKAGDLIEYIHTENVGRLFNPKWENSIIEIKVVDVRIAFDEKIGSDSDKLRFYYKLHKINSDGSVSKRAYNGGFRVSEEDIVSNIERQKKQ